jgi:hypothetical protein
MPKQIRPKIRLEFSPSNDGETRWHLSYRFGMKIQKQNGDFGIFEELISNFACKFEKLINFLGWKIN